MPGRETPAVRAARRAGIAFDVHEYRHDPRAESYALEAATALGLDPASVFKTLVVDLDGELAVCIVPAAAQLDTMPEHRTIFVSAGRRGLEIELAPADLIALAKAEVRLLRRTE